MPGLTDLFGKGAAGNAPFPGPSGLSPAQATQMNTGQTPPSLLSQLGGGAASGLKAGQGQGLASSLGGIGGGALGSYFGGPVGGEIGGSLGSLGGSFLSPKAAQAPQTGPINPPKGGGVPNAITQGPQSQSGGNQAQLLQQLLKLLSSRR